MCFVNPPATLICLTMIILTSISQACSALISQFLLHPPALISQIPTAANTARHDSLSRPLSAQISCRQRPSPARSVYNLITSRYRNHTHSRCSPPSRPSQKRYPPVTLPPLHSPKSPVTLELVTKRLAAFALTGFLVFTLTGWSSVCAPKPKKSCCGASCPMQAGKACCQITPAADRVTPQSPNLAPVCAVSPITSPVLTLTASAIYYPPTSPPGIARLHVHSGLSPPAA